MILVNFYEIMTEKHWREFLPKYYNSLLKDGTLEDEIKKAASKAMNEIIDLEETGLYRNEAEEIVLPKYIFLKPEMDKADED